MGVATRLHAFPKPCSHAAVHAWDLTSSLNFKRQVLYISADPDSWEFQPENTLKLKAWGKDSSDTTLLDLIPMLQVCVCVCVCVCVLFYVIAYPCGRCVCGGWRTK